MGIEDSVGAEHFEADSCENSYMFGASGVLSSHPSNHHYVRALSELSRVYRVLYGLALSERNVYSSDPETLPRTKSLSPSL